MTTAECERPPTSAAPSDIDLDHLVRRIWGEYLEMSDLRRTRLQAQRLWALDERTCTQVRASLVEATCLRGTTDGMSACVTREPVAAHACLTRQR